MLLCVVFIVFALLAVWWFSGDCCWDWLITWAGKAGGLYHQWRDHGDLGQASANCSTPYEKYCVQWRRLHRIRGLGATNAQRKHLHYTAIWSSE
jgi:hypothetical protein